MSYSIVRFYQDSKRDTVVLETGLTLEEAQAHCQDPETSSKTATRLEAISHTRECGPWFDGYREENRPRRRPGLLETALGVYTETRR